MGFSPVYVPRDEKPKSQYMRNLFPRHTSLFRDNCYLSTWLLMGAAIQGSLSFLPYRNISLVAPVFLLLLWRISLPFAMMLGLIENPHMKNVIPGRTVPVFAADGGIQDRSTIADKEIVVLVIAAKSNHPLGVLAPGFKVIGDYFTDMVKTLEANPTTYGFIGASSWLGTERGANCDLMSICYFESVEGLHAFAEGPLHVEGMNWWNKGVDGFGHMGIMHEVYAVPKKSFEGVYLNCQPTGLNATFNQVSIKDETGEKKVWMSPMVYGTGPLRYSKGRMGRSVGSAEKGLLDGLLSKNGTEMAM